MLAVPARPVNQPTRGPGREKDRTAEGATSRFGPAAPPMVRASARDDADAIEACFAAGWTDGLPVVPPEEHVVARFLEAVGWDPSEIVLYEPVRGAAVHAGAIVVNAVMAGCRPTYLPVVRAAIRAMAHPDFEVHPATSSTGGPGPVLVVNGPIRNELGLNSGTNVFGPGNRANAAIGRAVRLVLWNCMGARTGELDNATQGWFGKYTACFAEPVRAVPCAPRVPGRGQLRDGACRRIAPYGAHREWSRCGSGALDRKRCARIIGQPQRRTRLLGALSRARADSRTGGLDDPVFAGAPVPCEPSNNRRAQAQRQARGMHRTVRRDREPASRTNPRRHPCRARGRRRGGGIGVDTHVGAWSWQRCGHRTDR